MADVRDILNDDEFFGDAVDTPKEGVEQHKKQGCLKSFMDKGKVHLLGHKWTHGRVDKASDEIINKTYTEYRQRELNEKGEKTGKAWSKHVINLYSTGISRWLKIKDVKKYDRTLRMTESLKIKMAGLGCLFVCTFGNLLLLFLIAAHTANNVDSGGEPEDEGYKREA